jgi:hypothetical protein
MRPQPRKTHRSACLIALLLLPLVGCGPGIGPTQGFPRPGPPLGTQDREAHDERTQVLIHRWSESFDEAGLPVREDLEQRWWPNGTLRAERHWDSGVPVGRWATWWEDGAPRSVHEHETEPSFMTFWHPNGNKESEGLHLLGRKLGPWTSWDADGNVRREGRFEGGEECGVWSLRYASGALEARGVMRGGARVGKWKLWSESDAVFESDWMPALEPADAPRPGWEFSAEG